MEASTTIPSATTKLEVVMRFIVWPVTFMIMNVNRNDSGIERPMTKVALGLLRNRKMTRTAMMIPTTPDLSTFERDWVMLFESSENIWYESAPSVSSGSCASISRMALLILTVFPDDLFVTDTMIRLLPSDSA